MRNKLISTTVATVMGVSIIVNPGLSFVKAADSTTTAPKGLILSYQFDEATKGDKVIDSSGNHNDGTWGGDASLTSDGKTNGALNLDGKGFVKLPNNLFKDAKEATISAWVKFNPDANGAWTRIFDFGQSGDYSMFLARNRYISINVNKHPEDLNVNNYSLYPENRWVHVAVTYNGKSMVYYENGKEVARKDDCTNAISGLEASMENYIGKSKYPADPLLNAKVDDFRVYNTALDAKSIRDMAVQEDPALSNGLVLNYQFDDTKGDKVVDSSSQHNDGTYGGNASLVKEGKVGGALNLDGNGFVKLPDKLFKGMNAITIGTWVKFTANTNPWWQRIFDFGKDDKSFFFLAKNKCLNINVNSKVEGPAANGIFPDNQWTYVAVTYDGSSMKLYQDGEVVGTAAASDKLTDLEDSTQNFIGKSKFAADALLQAKVDDFRVYNRALSQDEIKAIRALAVNDADSVDKTKTDLDLGDTTRIISDLNLPTKGADDAQITWSSDNKAVISDEGKVTRPTGDKEVAVTLTATITSGSVSAQKTFKVTVFPANKAHYDVDVNVANPAFNISSTLTGAFFEDINHAADGGLYAELVENRSFENKDAKESWTLVKTGTGSQGTIAAAKVKALNANNPTYLTLKVTKPGDGVGISNDGYKGISVKKDAKYDFSVWSRSLSKYSGDIKVAIQSKDGKLLSDVKTISGETSTWKKYATTLTATTDDNDARLVVLADKAGSLDLDMVSLFPEDTWKGRKGGLRKDLVQKLADLKPKFFRFPGGCVVEGRTKEEMYNWKDTIGNVEQRKQNTNLWGYYQSYGLGFYEYFQLCEDIKAEPLPVVNVGMTCQARGAVNGTSDYLVDFEDLQPYVQDALDLIEYANGSITSKWGKKRAQAGHPKPFNLKYISVGNENWGADYWYRYQVFQEAINKKYPNIKVICAAGPVASGSIFDDAWTWANRIGKNDYIDEHYYMSNQWFLDNTHRYDSYDRKSTKVFLGEYAAQNGGKKNSLDSALAEAAYMTGLERNSDVVKMASYAPLFAKADDYQWNPDMIWFNNTTSYGTPNYYVQQMFSTNTGDKLLTSTKKVNFEQKSSKITGGIILGSWMTGVQYDDVVVKSNVDNKVIFSDNFSKANSAWKQGSGKWVVKDGKLQQTGMDTDCRMSLTNDQWSDYTLTLKATKKSGNEGFLVGFAATDKDNYNWYNIGGWGNTQTAVEKAVGGTKSTVSTADAKYGTVATNKEYTIKIVVHGSSYECYLNGELTNKYVAPVSESEVYTVSSYDSANKQVIVKLVNTTTTEKSVDVNLNGVKTVDPKGTAIVLTSDSQSDENSFDNPTKVAPVTKTVDNLAPKFTYVVPKNSVTILRINVTK